MATNGLAQEQQFIQRDAQQHDWICSTKDAGLRQNKQQGTQRLGAGREILGMASQPFYKTRCSVPLDQGRTRRSWPPSVYQGIQEASEFPGGPDLVRSTCQCKGYIQSLTREDLTCCGATKPMRHSYPEPAGSRACAPQRKKNRSEKPS